MASCGARFLSHPAPSPAAVQFYDFFSHKGPGAWRLQLQAAAFGDSTLVHKGHGTEKVLTAPTASVPLHELQGPFRLHAHQQRLSFPLSISLDLRLFLVGCVPSAISGGIKQSLSMLLHRRLFKDTQKLHKSAQTGISCPISH